MLITFCCYLPFLRRPPAFFVRAHSQVSAVRLGETYNRKEASQTWELPAHSHLLVAPWLSWGPSRSGRPDFFFPSQIQWNPRTKFHPHTHQPFLICMGMPPCHSWPEGEMVGKSSHLEHLRTGRTPTNIYKNRKFLHIWLFFHIAEQISTCYFLVVYLSLHTNWTLHRVYANNLLSFITWAF